MRKQSLDLHSFVVRLFNKEVCSTLEGTAFAWALLTGGSPQKPDIDLASEGASQVNACR